VPSEEIIIADSSPLIGLARIGRLELLPKLARRIVVPQAVHDEVTAARADAPASSRHRYDPEERHRDHQPGHLHVDEHRRATNQLISFTRATTAATGHGHNGALQLGPMWVPSDAPVYP
jgi:hypothetical protein